MNGAPSKYEKENPNKDSSPPYLLLRKALGQILKLAAGDNLDTRRGGSTLRADGLNLVNDVEAVSDLAEDDVLAIEPGGVSGANKELRSVGVGPSIRHGKDALSLMLEREVLIFKLLTINGFSPGAVSSGEVAALAHKAGDDTVEA